MERSREARRAAATMNGGGGGGLPRRRARGVASLRESPEEEGGMESPEMATARLRERGMKPLDRSRERSRGGDRDHHNHHHRPVVGRSSKRRRGERLVLRDDGEDSDDDTTDEDDDEDDDSSVPVRLPPPPPPPAAHPAATNPPSPAPPPLPIHNHHQLHQHHQQQQQQKSRFPGKPAAARAPAPWKADEMIGVPVPRKARSACTKRPSPHDAFDSSAGGGGDPAPHMKRTDSASPSRTSPASASQISPSSSNSSVRKKMKPMAGAGKQPQQQPQRPSQSPSPAPTSKPAMFIPEEIEVAEVLFGLTRQFQSNKEENHRLELKEPAPQSDAKPNPPPAPSGGTAPKRRLRRPASVEDESSTSPSCSAPLPGGSASSVAKAESVAAVKPEENPAPEPSSAENAAPQAGPARMEAPREEERREKNPISDPKLSAGGESREAPAPPSNASSKISDSSAGGSREHRPTIDLMAPPERDGLCDFDMDQKSSGPEIDTAPKASSSDKKQEEQPKANQAVESDKHPNKDRILDLQLNLDKPEKDGIAGAGGSRQAPKPAPQQQQQQPPPPPTTTKATPKAAETRMEKAAASATFPMPMTLGSWPGGFPPFGYLGQVPPFPGAAVMPMDAGNPGSSNAMLQPPPPPVFLPPPPRPKRCATHCYIAQNIRYHHQQLAKMNPFAAAAAAAAPLFTAAAKAYNPNGMPQQDAAAAAAAAALFTGVRNPAGLPDGKGAPVMAAFLGNLAKENRPSASSNPMESAQMKQVMLQQPPQSGSAPPSMLPGPAFFFPLNQQHVAAAAAAAAANRSGAAKQSNPSAAVPSSTASNPSATSSGVTGPAAAAMNLSFAGMPPADAQYVAILHNGNAYPYPVPAHAGGPQPYRGPPGPAQAIPFFGGPFYSSQMLHASQLHHHHHQQNASVVSGSASSQKHPPPQFPGGSANPAPAAAGHVLTGSNHRPNLMPHRSGQHGGDKGSADGPPSADGRCSQAQKMPNGHGFSMPMLPQNFALMSAPAAGKAGLGSGSSTGEKQPQSQSTKTELATSQPFAMPFAAFNSSQHPISLNESQISSILGASLNPARSSGAATPATTASGPTAGAVPNPQHQHQHQHHHQQQQQQQQQLAQQLQVQKQQQQLLAAKASALNANSTAKFPQTPISFPQALIQGGSTGGGNGSPGPASPQWRNPTARSPAPAASPSVASPAAKNNHVLQQQARVPQTQISFSVNPMASASAAATLASGAKNPASSPPSAAAVGVGTVANPISKSSSGGTQASATAKSGSSMTTAPSLPQQQPSILKSSAASNGNAPSSSSSTKPPPHQEPQQQQHPQMKHQPFAQNSYFYNPYFQDVQPQFKAGAPSAVMSGYHRKQLQQQHKQPVNAVLPDDGKAQLVAAPGAANNMKGMAPPGLLQAAHLAMTAQSRPGALQPLVPASLPYLSMPPMPVKPAATADQKPAAAD